MVALALLFDFTTGFRDSANAIATVAATHAALLIVVSPIAGPLLGAQLFSSAAVALAHGGDNAQKLMTLVPAGLAALLVVALRRAPSAGEAEDETDGGHEVPLRAGSGSLTGTARVPLTGPRPDPDRTRAVAAEIEDPR